jgi:hypothetical protein
MWDVRKSRGQYLAAHGRLERLQSERLSDVIGDFVPDGARSNFAVVAELISSVNASNGRGRRSEGVYCGVTNSSLTAESHATAKGAWIAIGASYVALLESVAAVSLALPRLLDVAVRLQEDSGDEEALRFLGNGRGSVFAFVGQSQGRRDLGETDEDLWARFRADPACAELVASALLWTICHELSHLTQGDKSARVDHQLRNSRRAAASRIHSRAWPISSDHQDELIADRTAIDLASRATNEAARLERLVPASIIAATALGVDGWFLDESAVSNTHPSPFLRAECLSIYWLDYLETARSSAWPDGNYPRDALFRRFAETSVLPSWFAGRFRTGRDGMAIQREVEDVWKYAVAAVGRVGLLIGPPG